MKNTTPMQETANLGCGFWNDSCALNELQSAIENGATGATSNPVIVLNAIKGDLKTWGPVIQKIVQDFSDHSEDEIAWKLIEHLGQSAAKLLVPIYEKSHGQSGYLSMQVSPKFHNNAQKMFEHGMQLNKLAPNIAIKAPATEAGLDAMEMLTAHGVRVNATVCFSISQAVRVAERIEKGLAAARHKGLDVSTLKPFVTIMVGRLDDHLQRVMTKEGINIDPGFLHWAGIAVFKKAVQIFKPFQSTLLVAAYRHHMHWSQLVGKNVVMTIPFNWWNQFNKSEMHPNVSVSEPVNPEIVETLYKKFADFRLAFDEGAMQPRQFNTFGPTAHTLNQFLTGYQDLVSIVREKMLS